MSLKWHSLSLLLSMPTVSTCNFRHLIHSSLSCHMLTLQVTSSQSPFQLLLPCLKGTFFSVPSLLLIFLGNHFPLIISGMTYDHPWPSLSQAKFSLLNLVPTQPTAYWMNWSVSEKAESPSLKQKTSSHRLPPNPFQWCSLSRRITPVSPSCSS